MSLARNKQLIRNKKETLMELPLCEWEKEIEKFESSKDIMDIDSLIPFITKFKKFYQENTLEEVDYRDSYPLVKYAIKDMAKPPNTL